MEQALHIPGWAGGTGRGLTSVTEPPAPASSALAIEVAHEVLADLSPLLVAGVWGALVRQVYVEKKEKTFSWEGTARGQAHRGGPRLEAWTPVLGRRTVMEQVGQALVCSREIWVSL